MTCPACGGPMGRVLYYGLPFRLCADAQCSTLLGSWLAMAVTGCLPFSGWMVGYTGSYWRALVRWLRGADA